MPNLLMVTTVADTLLFLLPFARHFRARGWRVDAVANGVSRTDTGVSAWDENAVQAFDRVWDLSWSRKPLHPRNLFSAPRRVRELVAREGYDLVHVHTPVAAFVTRMALRHMRRQGSPRLIYTAHGFHFYEGGPRVRGAIYRKLEQIAGRWTDYLVVINREDEQAARRYGIVPADRVRYMPGIGVDMQFYGGAVADADVARVRNELRLTAADRLFLMIAEYNPRKRHRDVLHALARIGRPDVHLAFAGVGLLFDDTKRLATDLGIADRVHFLGFRRDVPALVRASTAMVLPSEQEGLPRSVMESLCQGVPVIGSRIRGMSDLLADGGGRLVPVGDVPGIADAMTWMLDHPAEARALGACGRDAMAAYDLRRIIDLHEELYDEALGNVRPAAAADLSSALNR